MRYLKIIWVLAKNSWIRDSKITGYFISAISFRILEITVTIIFFKILFANTTSLAGWSYFEVLFLYAFARGVVDLNGAFIKRGVRSLAENLIRTGELDFFLLRPIDTIFLVSFSKPKMLDLLNCFFEIGIGVYAVTAGHLAINAANTIWFIFLGLFGIIIYYFLSILVITPAFWVIRLWSIQYTMNRLGQLMQYPAGVLPNLIRLTFYSLFPILAVAYLPVRVLFWGPKIEYVAYMLIITIILGVAVKIIWRKGEQGYSSASS